MQDRVKIHVNSDSVFRCAQRQGFVAFNVRGAKYRLFDLFPNGSIV